MDSSNEYTIEYVFKASVQGLQDGVQKVEGLIERAKDAAKGFGDQASESFYQAVGSINDLDTKTQALLASLTAVEAVFVKQSLSTFAEYEDAVYGMATTVGAVGGTITEALEGIRASTANGLVSETDLARGMNNLTAYGYSVEEATRLLQDLTNVAMAHRNETMTVSEQVERLTEGIKRGSSQMLKNNGLMVTASEATAAYAASIGKTASELDEAERRQAIYNSVVTAGYESAAVASAYQESYSAATQRLNNALDDLKLAFGQVLAPLATWLANAATWIAQNKALVAGLAAFVGVIAGAGGIAVALAKLIPMIQAAVAWFSGLQVATKGVILGLATVAATMAVVSASTANMTNSLSGVAQDAAEASAGMDDFTASVGGGGGGGGAIGAVRDLSAELEKLRRQYLEELKQIEVRHQETIAKLTKQIQEANIDYRRAVEERNAEFEVQQAKEEKKHQEKVDDIMTQIAFLQRYNNDYNKQKLANLEFALAKENSLYQKQTEAEKRELELQNANDKQAYEQRRTELQAELADEMAFMEKHRVDLQQVRDVILLDEIDSLNRRYEEQQKSYEQQTAAAGAAGAAIGDNLVSNLSKKLADAQVGQLQNNAFGLGSATSKSVISGVWEHIKSVANNDDENFLARIWKAILGENTFNRLKYGTGSGSGGGGTGGGWGTPYNPYSGGGFAYGGYTGQGAVNEVAGVVHKGEYVLPQEMVDQTTGTPKALGSTYNIYVEGVFATSAQERRRVADQIVQAINQNNKSRLEASWQ